jgi:hypothetical protein
MSLTATIRRAQSAAPVDLRLLASEYGIRIHNAWLDAGVSGELVPLEDGRFQINVSEDDNPRRQRFTVAHELGHYFLHRHLIGTGIGDDKAYRSTGVGRYHNTAIGPREETEANQFASNLLMPDHLIEMLRRMGKTTPQQMADELQVSLPAMRVRLGLSPRPVTGEGATPFD